MTWIDWLCLGTVALGVVLFLYGANYYDAMIGWAGVFLFIAGTVSFLAFSIYRELIKRTRAQNL
jgi:hypothetical protein